ncbi:hypothetical protein Fmac_021961 [Flemingia macrophylla]|uniref:RING-type E3 ubiquitin transferase n=1 Tax=Flemingia macrophylla TaxID=520843 RepID=A0ABD1LYD2_9FABA
MELANRRLLLLNEDVPMAMAPFPHAKHATNTSSPPATTEIPLQVSSAFASSVGYVFLILFTTFFFIGFVFLYFRQFPSDDAATFRRRRRLRPQSRGCEAAKSLPVVAHRGEAAECAICLEEAGEGEAVKVIPYCGHVFHPQCIDTWLESHVSCPVCRCSHLCVAAENQKESQEVDSVSVFD